MRILRLRAYCAPEETSGSSMDPALTEGLVRADTVTVHLTPVPSRGVSEEVRRAYRSILYEVKDDGYTIIRRFRMFPEKANTLLKAARYLCCTVAEYFIGIRQKDIDLVLCASTPPTQGMLSARVARRLSRRYGRKVPFVYNLQDIFPDSLLSTGMGQKGSLIWKIGRRMEDYTYRSASRIIVISEGFKRNIMAKGVPEDKITVISNWVDLNQVHPVPRKDNPLFDELGIPRDRFVAVYAGNLGESQGAEVIAEAAKLLTDLPDLTFVIFGGGARAQALEEKIREEKISGVILRPLEPHERVSAVYSMGDVALITCKKGTGRAGMPNKTWSIMACNTPIIASFDQDSDLSGVIRESGAGVCVPPEDPGALAGAIRRAYEARQRGEKPAGDERAWALNTVNKDVCVERFVNVLLEAAGKVREA